MFISKGFKWTKRFKHNYFFSIVISFVVLLYHKQWDIKPKDRSLPLITLYVTSALCSVKFVIILLGIAILKSNLEYSYQFKVILFLGIFRFSWIRFFSFESMFFSLNSLFLIHVFLLEFTFFSLNSSFSLWIDVSLFEFIQRLIKPSHLIDQRFDLSPALLPGWFALLPKASLRPPRPNGPGDPPLENQQPLSQHPHA